MTARRIIQWIVSALILGACGNDGIRTAGDDLRRAEAIDTFVARVERAVSDGVRTPAYGTRPLASWPRELVFITKKQSEVCLDVGCMLREAARRSVAGGQPRPGVAIPPDDVDAICRFLQRERVSLPVVILPEEVFPAIVPDLMYVRLSDLDEILTVRAAPSGYDLLSAVTAWRRERPLHPSRAAHH